MNMWYEDKQQLSDAIEFIRQFHCIYNFVVYASRKTPCYYYRKADAYISEGLKNAIRSWYEDLSRAERKAINAEFAYFAGESFFVRQDALVRIISRVLSDGDPRENTDILKFALQLQVEQRQELLKKLALP